MIASPNFCRFVICKFILRICCSTSSQRCSTGFRTGSTSSQRCSTGFYRSGSTSSSRHSTGFRSSSISFQRYSTGFRSGSTSSQRCSTGFRSGSTSSQRCSTGFRSGDWEGHWRTLNSLSCSWNQFDNFRFVTWHIIMLDIAIRKWVAMWPWRDAHGQQQ